jgi:two-component system, cell cycle response regulator DivK
MAEETILIVEDTPVSLKLSAVVLRAEGYKVHIASTAEQALMALKTVRPDLVLLDIRLPGMSGLDFTRQLKQDPLLKGVIVVALTSLNTASDEQRAREAGCDGYLTKPIDTRTLADSVRQFLDHGGATQVLGADSGPESQRAVRLAFPDPLVEDLRLLFIAGGAAESTRLMLTPWSQIDETRVGHRLLQWISTAGVLGLAAIAKSAREAEALLRDPDTTAAQGGVALARLSRSFEDAAAANPAPTLPAGLLEQLSGKRVALVGLAEAEADLLCAALERAGARPRLFDGTETSSSETLSGCPVAFVHLRPETLELPWFQPEFEPPPGMVVLFIGQRQYILSLDPVVLARASDCLIDFWQPEEALLRLHLVLSPASIPAAAAA